MTSASVTNAISTANKMLAKYGAAATWIQYKDAAPNVLKPEEPGARTVKSFPCKVLLTRKNRIGWEFLKFLAQTEIVESNEVALLAGACGFTPTKADKVTINGVTANVDTLNVVRPDGRPVLWIAGLKA